MFEFASATASLELDLASGYSAVAQTAAVPHSGSEQPWLMPCSAQAAESGWRRPLVSRLVSRSAGTCSELRWRQNSALRVVLAHFLSGLSEMECTYRRNHACLCRFARPSFHSD